MPGIRRFCTKLALASASALCCAGGAAADGAVEPVPALELDEGVVRLLVEHAPEALGPLSVGTPDSGLLIGAVALPDGPLWKVRDPLEAFGTAETIDFITAAVGAVEARHPGSPRLLIGDISGTDGGRLNRHRSHQAGRDADIGFYYSTGEAAEFRAPRRNELDLTRTWSLVRAFLTETDVERIFLDRSLQGPLYAHALASGEDRAWLDDVFGRRGAGKDAIIQHVRGHRNHLHVRFYNRTAQELGRIAYPLLVRAGLVPQPTRFHRARAGDTLAGLARRYGTSEAAIRAANGLRGSALQAGRAYVIPVRRVRADTEPVVVPARRLPKTAPATEGERIAGEGGQ